MWTVHLLYRMFTTNRFKYARGGDHYYCNQKLSLTNSNKREERQLFHSTKCYRILLDSSNFPFGIIYKRAFKIILIH